jgi:hypothetical protein
LLSCCIRSEPALFRSRDFVTGAPERRGGELEDLLAVCFLRFCDESIDDLVRSVFAQPLVYHALHFNNGSLDIFWLVGIKLRLAHTAVESLDRELSFSKLSLKVTEFHLIHRCAP